MVLIIVIIISFGVSVFGSRPWFPHFRFSVSAKNFHFGASLTVTLLEFKLKPVKCKNKLAIRVYKTKWKDLFARLALSLQRQFQEELCHRHQRHSKHTIQYGFTSVMECYEEKPKCLLCSKVLSRVWSQTNSKETLRHHTKSMSANQELFSKINLTTEQTASVGLFQKGCDC